MHDTPRDRSWFAVRAIAAIALTSTALLAAGSCERPADDRPIPSPSYVEPSDRAGPKRVLAREADDKPVRAPWGGLQVAERGNGERAVLMLHGYGSRGDDFVDFATEIVAEVPALYVIPGGPLTNSTGEGRAWFEPALSSQRDEEDRREAARDVGASRARLDGVVETLFGRGVGRDAVVVAGFSQGGTVASDLAICGENPIHAVAVFSGAHFPRCNARRRIEGMRWFVSHGARDDIIPAADADRVVAELERQGAVVEYVLFDGGHEIPPEVLRRFVDWLATTFAEL